MHTFAPMGNQAVETEYLPPPDAGPNAPLPGPSGPLIQGPVVSGPVAGAPAPAPIPAPARKKSKLPLILGVLVLLFLLCAGVPAVVWVAYSLLGASAVHDIDIPDIPDIEAPDDDTPDANEEPVEVPAGDDEPEDAPSQDPTPDAASASGQVGITIRAADRLIRRLEIATPDGELIEGSKGSVDTFLAPGPYRLTIKVAGRDPVSADLTVGDIGLDLLCAPDDKMVKVLCKNADGDITMVLK